MFANCIFVATFFLWVPLFEEIKHSVTGYSAQKVMKFGVLVTDIPVYVSCKFKKYIFKVALVISENVRIAFLYVMSIHDTMFFSPVCSFPQRGDSMKWIKILHSKRNNGVSAVGYTGKTQLPALTHSVHLWSHRGSAADRSE